MFPGREAVDRSTIHSFSAEAAAELDARVHQVLCFGFRRPQISGVSEKSLAPRSMRRQ
jgi:hypothetical protein